MESSLKRNKGPTIQKMVVPFGWWSTPSNIMVVRKPTYSKWWLDFQGYQLKRSFFFQHSNFFLHFPSRITRRPFRSICKIWVFVNLLEVKTSNIESLFFWKSPTWFAKFGGTSHAWMSQEVSKRLGSVGYSPTPFTGWWNNSWINPSRDI